MVFTHLQVKEIFSHLASQGSEAKSRAGTRSHPGEGLGESPELWGRRGSWSPSLMLTSMAFFPGWFWASS